MSKTKRPTTEPAPIESDDYLLHAGDFLDHLAVGTWVPHVDTCETADRVIVRVELPGVDSPDISITVQHQILRVQGIKREPPPSRKLLCYYCLERRYGRFDRSIPIDWVVDAQRARAFLDSGLLTVELPKLGDRRGRITQIRIEKK